MLTSVLARFFAAVATAETGPAVVTKQAYADEFSYGKAVLALEMRPAAVYPLPNISTCDGTHIVCAANVANSET